MTGNEPAKPGTIARGNQLILQSQLLIGSFLFWIIYLFILAETSLATAMGSLPEEVVEEMVMEKRISAADKTLSNAERLEYFLDQMERIKDEERMEAAVRQSRIFLFSCF